MNYCNCYREYQNYKLRLSPWNANIKLEEIVDNMKKYEQWQGSIESQQVLRKFAPEKAIKSITELVDEQGRIFENGRVSLKNNYIFHDYVCLERSERNVSLYE